MDDHHMSNSASPVLVGLGLFSFLGPLLDFLKGTFSLAKLTSLVQMESAEGSVGIKVTVTDRLGLHLTEPIEVQLERQHKEEIVS